MDRSTGTSDIIRIRTLTMTRKMLLGYLRLAGYENDRKAWTRLYVEHRIGFVAAEQSWNDGVNMRGRADL